MVEQPLLAFEAAAIAGQAAVRADHPMAGHDDADRVLAVGADHRDDVAGENADEVLAHRLWSDLRKGWRYTNPNLEEVGLISARFPGLDDLISDDSEFAENSYLSAASLDQRRKLYELLFQHMRQGLAVAPADLVAVPA